MQSITEIVKSNKECAYCLADSPYGEEIKSKVRIIETEEAEKQFYDVLMLITDPELRERVDQAAGRISYAYEKLGFVEGFIAKRALGCLI